MQSKPWLEVSLSEKNSSRYLATMAELFLNSIVDKDGKKIKHTHIYKYIYKKKKNQGLITLKVGVRRPFSKVKGSKTNVTAFTNSKPLS